MPKQKDKIRVDDLLVERGEVIDKAQVGKLVLAGKIQVNHQRIKSPALKVSREDEIVVEEGSPFVGRGALKLQCALDSFKLSVTGAVCADVGSSTGGFTDLLLQRGARRVFAIDVGYGELAWKLRSDPRVTVMERTNARSITRLDQPCDFVVMDVSFISARVLLPGIKAWLSENGTVVVLIKPQFEAERELVGEGGIVRDPAVHSAVIEAVLVAAHKDGYCVEGLVGSPIRGAEGNREFLCWLSLRGGVQSLETMRSASHAVLEEGRVVILF